MSDLETRLSPEEITKYLETCPEDPKGRKLVPDDFFDQYYKQLPNGTLNQSGTYRAFNGGRLIILGSDPERDKDIHVKGAEALNARNAQRRTFKEEIDILLAKIDDENGMTGLENVTVAMYDKARNGDVKAAAFLRDTAGEQPVTKQEIKGEIMTDADKTVIENALKRLKNRSIQADDPSI